MFDKWWTVKEWTEEADEERAARLSKEAGIPAFLAETLVKRGVRDAEEAQMFFAPSIQDFHDPYLFDQMENAVQRIIDACEDGERVTVFGDYDCDGICATAILWHFLTHQLELRADWFIPRREDGYGLSEQAVRQIAERGTTLIVTVDCGITGCAEVELARTLGIDVIVTDHHRPGEARPDAVAVIDPVLPDCPYPFRYLCGAGVAYKLAEALAEAIGLDGRPLEYLPFAAMASIGDSVSLTGENRAIVFVGMQHMAEAAWPGLQKLMESAGVKPPITVRSVAFGLVPRVNAAGRMGSGERALRLLLTESEEEAAKYAEEIAQENHNRQQLESQISAEAVLPEAIQTSEKDAVVISLGKNWHHGVVGIVAARLVERFNKPALVFAYESDGVTVKGSARSVPGFNIHQALGMCRECLEKFGGHEMAAGLSLKADRLPELIEGLNRYAKTACLSVYTVPEIQADAELPLSNITLENAALLEQIQPCGEGNPEPVYLAKGLRLVKCLTVGNTGAHLRFQFSLEDGAKDACGRPVSGIAFQCGPLAPLVSVMDRCDVLCKMSVNEWNGNQSVSLQILDIREADVYNTACDRQKLVRLYNAVRQSYRNGFTREDLPGLLTFLKQCDPDYTWFKLFKAIEIFNELDILQKKGSRYVLNPSRKELSLEQSDVYKACRALKEG